MTLGTWCGLAAGGLALLLNACSKPEAKPLPPPSAVINASAHTVEPEKPPAVVMPVLNESVATIQGSEEIPVKASQAGYLVRQVYKDGTPVAAGDVLFLLDPRTTHDGAPTEKSALVRVVSPVAGFPGEAWHGAGDWVDPNMALTDVARIDEVEAELNLPDPLARQFIAYFDQQSNGPGVHKDFELILPDGSVYPETGYAGTMPSDGAIHVLNVIFPNPKHVLQPGEFVKVRSAIK